MGAKRTQGGTPTSEWTLNQSQSQETNKESDWTVGKQPAQREAMTGATIQAPNSGAPEHLQQISTKPQGERDSDTVTGNPSARPSAGARSSEQKTSKHTTAGHMTQHILRAFCSAAASGPSPGDAGKSQRTSPNCNHNEHLPKAVM